MVKVNSFWMDIIATIKPGTNTQKIVPGIQVTTQDIGAISCLNIHYCKSQFADMPPLVYKYLEDMDIDDSTALLDVLWRWFYCTLKCVVEIITNAPHTKASMDWHDADGASGWAPGQSSVHFLPMIDMNSSDPNNIYSTLKCVCFRQATTNSHHGVITFDQPLWWKALLIS